MAAGLKLSPWLRRRIRAFSRIDWRVPRHAGLKGTALLFAATGLAGIISADRVGETVTWLSSVSGLAIESVRITGQTETSEIAVLNRLELPPQASLATFDLAAARERVETLPWVETATLRKIYPATLKITIDERKPYVMWQRDQTVSVIDESGRVIGDASEVHYQDLIRVVGQGADKRAGEAIALADTASSIRSRLRAAVLISERRWNLMLDNGVTLMLPQDKPEAALALVAQLDARDGLLSKDIVSIDLRLADRMFVRMTPEAAARRTVAIKEREKLAKRKGAST
ncbi:FtsQ-type POTRA domain-containing protein [Kaistia defluvii]|uniref:cell division protein FtsQ/DivIB n=1 Tax=Kaistia defluvii TaxID=410841 RepID=UPI0022596462|nr:cell division protein FtsQ/DivIB [Kaistia defluvii]MCX5516963.1 FtsQ-type POTRA domain-containing protein [Kaistia defluvii]